MTAQSTMIHVRVDEETKALAGETLASMGLSLSDAVRLFLHRVVAEQAFPLELKVPNAETRAAIAEAREMLTARKPRFRTADALMADLDAKPGQ